ncbi:MAG: 30S ribosomal protein S12 methylthiotransferase RimO [bacterium]|nr:MAG: 30S ribosomal protein S12 methylthiotransferase RimO [bacterium]
MKICVLTLGCPKNIVDSEYLLARLFDKQAQFVDRAEQADVVIINTCAFILPARAEAIETILEAVQLKEIGKIKRVYVTGCLPQRYLDELQKEIPEVDGFFDEYDFFKIGKKLSHQLNLNSNNRTKRRIIQTPNHYAYLKIADGCDNRCRYCTIPEIKGSYRDRPLQDLLDEAKELADSGVRELILVAQDTTYYGWKQGNKKLLCDLINSIAKIEPIKWIRILYAHPTRMNDCIIQLYNEHKKLCRYIDLPIQHISDKILESMGRPISSNEIRRLINKMREKVPGIAIRTTLMVGYPGEDEQDFALLKEFITETEFERLGVFKFYPEDRTDAAKMSNQVDESIKEDRYEEIMEIQAAISLKKNHQLLGRTLSVIIDAMEEDNSGFLGRTQWDSPSIDNAVHVTGNLNIGRIYPVTIDQVSEYDLWGKVTNIIH